MDGRSARLRLSKLVSVRLVNPLVRVLLERGLCPPTQALLETTGRRSGLPRRVPVGNGLRGGRFWIVSEHGLASDYVKNIGRDPRVRVKVGRTWHTGVAHLLPDDDPLDRLRWLRRPVNDAMVRFAGTALLTVRIDLDRRGEDGGCGGSQRDGGAPARRGGCETAPGARLGIQSAGDGAAGQGSDAGLLRPPLT